MKLIYLLIICIVFTSCVKNGIAPASAANKSTVSVAKTDSVKITGTTATTTTDYNGTNGTAILQVTCNSCTAIALVNNVGTPFIFNNQGVGELKYTPTPGTSVYIAICPNSVKTISANIFDASGNLLYSYSGTTGNWSTTYLVK